MEQKKINSSSCDDAVSFFEMMSWNETCDCNLASI